MKTQMIILSVILISLAAPAIAKSQSVKVPKCEKTEYFSPVETICKTSEGFYFKRYRNPMTGIMGWEDIGTEGRGGIGGKIWYDAVKNDVTTQEAINFCTSVKLDMPTEENILTANDHGIKEVLKDNPETRFWTLTNSESRDIGLVNVFGHAHLAFTGIVHSAFYTYPYGEWMPLSDQLNVRCVGVSGVNN